MRGPKLNTFYIKAMGENRLFKISNFDELGMAVDIHVAKFTLCTGVLKIAGGSYKGCIHKDPLRSMIEGVWSEAARRLGRPAWRLDEPIWTKGSKLCARKAHTRCPVKDLCEQRGEVRFRGTTVELGLVKRWEAGVLSPRRSKESGKPCLVVWVASWR